MFRNQKGITLIALVITIIVLLILAGITIALITNNDSAPNKAAEAKIIQDVGAAKDAIAINAAELVSDYYTNKYVGNSTDSTSSPQVYVQKKSAYDASNKADTTKTYGLFKLLNNVTILSFDNTGTKYTFVIRSDATKSKDGKLYAYEQTGTITEGGTVTWTNVGSDGWVEVSA